MSFEGEENFVFLKGSFTLMVWFMCLLAQRSRHSDFFVFASTET